MTQLVSIFIGGGLGACLRFLIGRSSGSTFVWVGTLLSNILACFILGYLAGSQTKEQHKSLFLLVGTGFCGGLSTFSTFTEEIFFLGNSSSYLQAILYPILSLFVGLSSFFAGIYTANYFK